uniref:Uncharacterized protein n=1 Tax=Arundo donax TaxID=35708 RepID=A0A0A9C440_ARUDO
MNYLCSRHDYEHRTDPRRCDDSRDYCCGAQCGDLRSLVALGSVCLDVEWPANLNAGCACH